MENELTSKNLLYYYWIRACKRLQGVFLFWLEAAAVGQNNQNQYINGIIHALLSRWGEKSHVRALWVNMVEFPLRILWGHCKSPHPNPYTWTGHTGHAHIQSTFMCFQSPVQLLFLCWQCPMRTPGALLSRYSGWVIPKWTCWLTASDKLSAQLISVTTTSLSSPACMINSTLFPLSYCQSYMYSIV